jgi:hypothetical protein
VVYHVLGLLALHKAFQEQAAGTRFVDILKVRHYYLSLPDRWRRGGSGDIAVKLTSCHLVLLQIWRRGHKSVKKLPKCDLKSTWKIVTKLQGEVNMIPHCRRCCSVQPRVLDKGHGSRHFACRRISLYPFRIHGARLYLGARLGWQDTNGTTLPCHTCH